MKKFLPLILLVAIACGPDFEPDLSGWKAYTHPARRVYLEIDGKERMIQLPGDDSITFRYPQLTTSLDQIILIQLTRVDGCTNYQLVAIDTTGSVIDTIYTPPPKTPLNFRLAPNDSLLLLKTYTDNCNGEAGDFKYTFYDRHLRKALADTIRVRRAKGIPMQESAWSPDSKKVIISEWSGKEVKGYVYDLVTKDTTRIDKGSNFVWSPTDDDLVAYIKDNSIYGMNVRTGEKNLIFEGENKRAADDFRFDPTGKFLMIHLRRYLLNVESNMTRSTTIIYFSLANKEESRVYYDDRKFDTWKSLPSDR
jgi:hypothetical protein